LKNTPDSPSQKNINYGNITAGGDVHIGDNYYLVEKALQHSILFLRIEPAEGGIYSLNMHIKSRHDGASKLGTSGEPLLQHAVAVNIPAGLFDDLMEFQAFRRGSDSPMRLKGEQTWNPSSIIAFENRLSQQLYDAFFSGDIGQVCADFIHLLESKRIEELLLVLSTNDEKIINLPFEMVLPLLFPSKLGEAKKSLTASNFGLVRTKVGSLEAFNMQGDLATAAPLKMLFITALPEDLDERGKMLQIEEEQTRLIQSIGALEATGDSKPKIAIEFLENASLEELDKALSARQHDIVHISGHGAYHAGEKKGVLYFENEDGDEEQVSGAALGECLRGHQCVKLLILSACETAMAGQEGGVTEQAATFGVPAIVAMRFAVTDEGAKVFTTELYTRLAQAQTLTRSLAYAREALHREVAQRREAAPHVPYIAEWFTPVIYQNQAMGSLIDPTQPYHLPDQFYPQSSFLKTSKSRLIGEGFIGRKRYLIQMRQAFRADKHVCLHGLGGLGKTTLAEAFAHNYDNHSHQIVIFRNGNQINEAHILQTLQKRFEQVNPALAAQTQEILDNPQVEVLDKLQVLLDNYLRGRKTILIFDNVEDVQTDEEGQYHQKIASDLLGSFLKYLCENTPKNCHILFTTRYKIDDLADVVMHLPLDKMGYAEQYRLLNYSEVLRKIDLKDRDDVYKRLDGHPRGYEYLEALLKKDKTFSWQQVAKSEEKVFENLLLAKVYERLTEPEQQIFQLVSVFISRTPPAALAAVSGQPEAALMPVLQALQDWSLCFLEKDGRFEVHRLTREWMGRHVVPDEKRKVWALKAGEYFENQFTVGDDLLAKAYYEEAEAWEGFARTSFRLQGHCQLIGMYPQAFELNQAVLERNIDDKTNADALNYNGMMLHSVGQYDTALGYLEQSLAIQQQIGDRQGEGATLNNISQIHKVRGDYDTALGYLEQSLAIQQQIGDRMGEGTTLNNLATTAYAKGDYDTALTYLEQSLAIRQQIGDRNGEGATLNNISQIYDAKGDYDTALAYLEQSLAIRQQIGDRKGEGATLNNLATTAYAKGDYDTALGYLEQSLAIQQQIGDRQGEGVTLNNISQIHKVRGDYDTALGYLEQSLAIRQQIGDINGVAENQLNIGAMLFEQNRYDEAIPLLRSAYQIFQKIGSPAIKNAEGYLNAILQRIGEDRFKAILSTLQ